MSHAVSPQVYEYMDSDLEILIRDRATIISPADVKSYMQMVLQSLLACKQHWVLHRDIKPSNFLISVQGKAAACHLTSDALYRRDAIISYFCENHWLFMAAIECFSRGDAHTVCPLDVSASYRRDEVDGFWACPLVWEP